jgi:hypothetical protein
MNRYQPCSSCACHVRHDDARCPFCDAPNAARAARSIRLPRMSRAQWLAFGSTLAFVGCTGNVAPIPPDPGAGDGAKDAGNATHDSGSPQGPEGGVATEAGIAHEDAGAAQEAGETAEASTDEGGTILGCATRTGYYECGGNVCDRSIQACFSGECEWYGDLAATTSADASASCGPCPSCTCLQGVIYPNCTCSEDAQGTVVISCGGCYGAPPARLERLA